MIIDFIANKIIEAKEKSLTAGQAKYRAYFIKLPYYTNYKEAVDAILVAKNHGDCIVTK